LLENFPAFGEEEVVGSAVMRRSRNCNRQPTSQANPIGACAVSQPER
jgi:hypothetical protein